MKLNSIYNLIHLRRKIGAFKDSNDRKIIWIRLIRTSNNGSIVDWHFQSLEQGFQKNPKVENFIRRIEFTD
ncbi:hypothetical protein DLM77_06585 [Leptospira yasudae]|uniref:Uncharacterized protein n=1 Tax=Leptospira yasudae TaxID=2202201 RepID=A0ABX9M494_9LEPT|nr:hypothetical protein DLM77_06585 [Leptospira yasudae]